MNVISQLPRWAQGPVQSFLEQGKIEGIQQTPLDQDSFDDSFKQGAGVLMLAAQDEIPGEDSAMGQPGVVKRNGVTIYYEGDSSDPRNQVDAASVGRRAGIEYTTYVQSRPNGYSTLRLINDDGAIEVHGSFVQRKNGKLDGYILTGDLST